MFGAVDVATWATTVSATVTAGAAMYVAGRVRAGVDALLGSIEDNRERSEQNERLLLGGEAYPGVVTRVRRLDDAVDPDGPARGRTEGPKEPAESDGN